MKRRYKTPMLVAILVIAALVVSACAPAAAPTPTPTKAPVVAPTPAPTPKPAPPTATAPPKVLEPIKLGYTNSFSGYAAAMGRPGQETIVLFEEKINKEGGINGRPLQVIYYDDESDESKGVMAVKKLIEADKVLGIIGCNASGIAMAESVVTEEAKVPIIHTNSLRASVEPSKKWSFKLPVSEFMDGAYFFYFLKEKMGVKKFAALTSNVGAGKEGRKYIDRMWRESGMTLVAAEEYDVKGVDFLPQLTRIKAAGPEGMILWGAEPAGAIAVGQARGLGMDIPVIASSGIIAPAIREVKELAAGLEGLYTAGYKPDVWETLPDTDIQKKPNAELARLIKAKHGRAISIWESLAHDALMIMVNAIKAANPDPTKVEEARAKIRDAIETGTKDFVGAQVLVDRYTPTDHEGSPDPRMRVLTQVKGGKIVEVK